MYVATCHGGIHYNAFWKAMTGLTLQSCNGKSSLKAKITAHNNDAEIFFDAEVQPWTLVFST
jgi:hypothetical protein